MSDSPAAPATIDPPIGASPSTGEAPVASELAIPPPNRPGRDVRLVVMRDVPGPDLALVLSPSIELQLLTQIRLLTEAAQARDPRVMLRAIDIVLAATECLDALVNNTPAALSAQDVAKQHLRDVLQLSGDEGDGPETLLACLNTARRRARAALDALEGLPGDGRPGA